MFLTIVALILSIVFLSLIIYYGRLFYLQCKELENYII